MHFEQSFCMYVDFFFNSLLTFISLIFHPQKSLKFNQLFGVFLVTKEKYQGR